MISVCHGYVYRSNSRPVNGRFSVCDAVLCIIYIYTLDQVVRDIFLTKSGKRDSDESNPILASENHTEASQLNTAP